MTFVASESGPSTRTKPKHALAASRRVHRRRGSVRSGRRVFESQLAQGGKGIIQRIADLSDEFPSFIESFSLADRPVS